MAEKTVKVRLIADVAGYLRGMSDVAKATREAEAASEDAKARLESQSQAMTEIGRSSMILGGAIAAGIGLAVAAYAQFDEAMSQVEAAAIDQAESWGALREEAIRAGAETKFSAVEAAQGIEELIKAGVSAEDVLAGGLSGALNLAAADNLSVAAAAETAASAMTQFKLSGEDVGHIADLLAAGAGKAQGGVSDMAEALNQAGLVASSTGLSIEETVGTLTAFASAGLLGSDAGTSFRTMLMRLQNPMGKAAEEMSKLGINAYDASGQFVGMSALAGQLQSSLSGLTDEQRNASMAIIFGQDAVRAASILYNEGAEGIARWTDEVDSAGYASMQARIKMDNLKGDLEQLGGSWETMLIRMGESADGPLRGLVQTLDGIVDGLGRMTPEMQTATMFVGTLAAGILLVGGAALTIIPQVAATSAALATLGITASGTKAALMGMVKNPWVVGLALVGAALGALNHEIEKGVPSQAEIANAMLNSAEAADVFAAAAKRGATEIALMGDYGEYLKDLPGLMDSISGDPIGDWLNTTVGQKGALDSLSRIGTEIAALANDSLPAAQQQFKGLATAQNLTAEQQYKLLDTMGDYKESLIEAATAQGIQLASLDTAEGQQQLLNLALGEGADALKLGSTAGEKFSDALSTQSAAANDVTGSIESLADALRDYNSVLYDSINAEMGYYEAVDAATAAVEKNGQTLDLTSEAGRNNMSALMDLGQASRDYAADVWETTGSVTELEAALQAGWQQVYDTAIAMGASEQDAINYANSLNGIPSEIATEIMLNSENAQIAVNKFVTDNDGRTISIYTNLVTGDQSFSTGNGPRGVATGGEIYGTGPKGIDSVPIMAAPGEHMLTAREVDLMGGQGAVYAWRAALRSGRGIPGYADGGAIGYAGGYSNSVTNNYSRPLHLQLTFTGTDTPSLRRQANLAAEIVAQKVGAL